jgi:SAM-dependent methyltransferase
MDRRPPTAPPRAARNPRDRWRSSEAGARYASGRWSSERRRARDPRIVDQLLARHLPGGRAQSVLDAPCGSGRLAPLLRARSARYVGLDVSPSMLAEAGRSGGTSWVRGDLAALPFADGTFEVVVACRILHHLDDQAELGRVLGELTRVASRWIVLSYWDARSLPALRRAWAPWLARAPRGRVSHPRAVLERILCEAGSEVVDSRHSLRFLSAQAFLVARKLRA